MGSKIQGPENKKIWYSCSPGHVRKYLKGLSPQQKDYVRKIGFGSFLSMADFELDKDLTLWLFQRFNCETESLEFDGGISIPVRALVKSVLGIPSGPIQVVQGSFFDTALYYRYYVGNVDPSQRHFISIEGSCENRNKGMDLAGKQICSETEEKQFCVAFMMAILALYLAPNKNASTSKPFFGAVQQVDKISQMDWCDFTASYLFEGIQEFQASDQSVIKVKGCVHILSVIFIDLVKNAALKIPDGFPRICIVNTLHKESVKSCSHPQVCCLEESVYASVLDETPNDIIIKNSTLGEKNPKPFLCRWRRGPKWWRIWLPATPTRRGAFIWMKGPQLAFYRHPISKFSKCNIIEGRKCADSDTNTDTNTDAGANQFGTTVEDTTRNSTELMETHHYSLATIFHKEVVYSRGTSKEPEDPLEHGRSILGRSQKKDLISTELGTAISCPSTLSLSIVEPPELDTSTPSTVAAPSFFTEYASHTDAHTRQESFIITANADSTHHHSVEQEHINFQRHGQQLQFDGPSSEPYSAQIDEGVQVAPDVSLGRNGASPSSMEEGGQSAKKARMEQPSGHVDPAGLGAVVDTSLLNCPLCSRHFKPPVFQCKGGHLACGTCLAEVPSVQCNKCEHGGAFDVHNMMMDTIILSAKIKCSYDGCQSYVSYHELEDHQSTCPCAPCFCTEPGCGFVGLPLALLSHLTTLHSWPVHSIEYGKELRLQVLVLEPQHLLLGEEDDCVFLLVVGAAATAGQSTATAVSVVRLGTCPALQPQYMLNILVYLPPAAASRRAHMLLLDMDVESNSRPGEVAVEELASYLTVPPAYLVGAGASREVSLNIRIDKIVS